MIEDWAQSILLSGRLEDKLAHLDVDIHRDQSFSIRTNSLNIPVRPKREKKIEVTNRQDKFPKRGSFIATENRAKALHFFANHELLAIEMMAAAIVCFPTLSAEDVQIKKSIVGTLKDEQKHFKLYEKRMNELGAEFGSFSINDYFWKIMHKVQNLKEFLAVMALTFEAANLDFCLYYANTFESFEDEASARIMNEVYKDEITHVALGAKWFKYWSGSEGIWEHYLKNLPSPLSPARGKGMSFDRVGRLRAKLPIGFVDNSEAYRDEFSVVNRSQW